MITAKRPNRCLYQNISQAYVQMELRITLKKFRNVRCLNAQTSVTFNTSTFKLTNYYVTLCNLNSMMSVRMTKMLAFFSHQVGWLVPNSMHGCKQTAVVAGHWPDVQIFLRRIMSRVRSIFRYRKLFWGEAWLQAWNTNFLDQIKVVDCQNIQLRLFG